jgi:circadian clock protein KaiB
MATRTPDVPASATSAPIATVAGSADETGARYILRLYVAGMTSRSTRAVENVRAFCAKHLEGRYDLQIIDLYQQPALAKSEQLIAAPTLIKKLPLPLRRLIGDMSNEDRILVGLDLVPRP